ncbi:MAG: NAD(P) transhydrogenase subunit alpha, partial [bacterium]|nr:NAD(P) transhydrogenase subunit alpha [bacterium]
EAGAGEAAGFLDSEYAKAGVQVLDERLAVASQADALLYVRTLGANPQVGRVDLESLRRGQVLIGFAEPLTAREQILQLAQRGVSLFAMELVPRISRAQSMDALSSMATVAGYKAALLAAEELPKMFPLLMTAAGTVAPARVLIIGAGVAGLQAIATARRLGAVVSAYDVRPAVKEQVESLGAQFVELDVETEEAEGVGGYAKAQDESFYRRQQEALGRVVAEQDVLITTAAVPGRPAPLLVTEHMVAGMASGSVVVDIAAERGGNCALTRPGETVVVHGVTILGPVNLMATVPYHASQMYSRNITSLFTHLVEEGQFKFDMKDEITRETLVMKDGEVIHTRVCEALGFPRPE